MNRPATYRCERCDNDRTPCILEGNDRLCLNCSDVVSRVYLCVTCDQRQAESGTDDCLQCIADGVVACPAELEACEPELAVRVARVLAERLRPFLSVRQAA